MQPAPRVVVVTGAPGAGKSVTGAAYARLVGAALLDQDAMTNPLVDVVAGLLGASDPVGPGASAVAHPANHVDYADPRLAAAVRDARYDCLLRVAEDCLRAGVAVVLVAPFSAERRDPAAWERLAARLTAAGGAPALVWLRIAPAELERRLVGRASARDAGKLRDVRSWVAGLDLAPPSVPFVEVDATAAPPAQAAAVRDRLA